MKIETTTQTLERGSLGKESSFRIRSNRRAFQILSSNLYADKIKAVIRELSCNARDSHVAAGHHDLPFDVHLPNNMEPWFSVTDYGTGLSHDQIMDIYTTYFASSKSDSNDYIGALGLGSKSPFAYTDTYDVITNFNGEKHSYVMFISEDGEPSVAHMGTNPTTDRNGVTVKVPVKTADFHNFCHSAKLVFMWFDHAPVVIGNSSYNHLLVKKELDGDGWYLHDNTSYHYRTGAMARMGNVVYPINSNQVNKKFYNMLNMNFVLEFKIGELDVAASREELSYDPVTVKVIEARLEKMAVDLLKVTESKFANCKTLWDARVALSEMNRNYSTRDMLRLLTNAGFKPKFNGQEVDDSNLRVLDWFDKGKAPRVFEFNGTRMEEEFRIEISSYAKFIRKDVHNTSSRVRLLFEGNTSFKYWVIDATDEQFQKVIDNLGNPPVILASSLPAPPRRVMEFKGSLYKGGNGSSWGRGRISDNWDVVTTLKTDMTAFYVTVDRYTPVDPTGNTISRLHDKMNYAKKLGIISNDIEVWGINKTNAKKIEEDDNWTEFSGYLSKKFEEFLATHDLADILQAKTSLVEVNNMFYSNSNHWNRIFGNMQNKVGDFVRAWNNTKIDSTFDIDVIRGLASVLNLKVDTNNNNPLMTLYQEMMKEYPLLRFSVRHYNDELGQWVPYINALDFVKANKKD